MSSGRKDENRGTGRTTSQIKMLPHEGVFVWVNERISYPLTIARNLKRLDIKVVGPSWLMGDRFRGVTLSGIAIDHECYNRRMDEGFWNRVMEARSRVRRAG